MNGTGCLHDQNCCVRNLIVNPKIIPGGGQSEVAASLAVLEAQDSEPDIEQYTMRGFQDALDDIPSILAENSGLPTIQTVTDLKQAHLERRKTESKTPEGWMGVDAMLKGTNDMWDQNVYEALSSKLNQFRLATQVVKMILKIDDVISSSEGM